MNLSQYVKTLFIILWSMIAFVCPISVQQKSKTNKTLCFYNLKLINTYFYNIFVSLKALKNKIIPNKKNKTNKKAVYIINKKKKQVSNIFNTNNKVLNQSLKLSKDLSYLRLKDAQATQNLISKQHFIRLQDKCAFLYPFVSKKHCSLYIF